MDILFGQVSDPGLTDDQPELSTLSDASSTAPPRGAAHSDGEVVLLATSRPKKRAGRRVFKETRHPIFRGVRRRNNNKWVCELREPNKKTRIWLGTYPSPEMAARAHDVAALALRGKSACLNFADSVWRLPVPTSTDAKDIRKAAAEAAEAFRPRDDQLELETIIHHGKLGGVQKTLQENTLLPENVLYMDEQAVFDMPRLLVDMAEGLLLSPPPLHFGDDNDMKWDDHINGEIDGCVSLWSHSI